MFWLAGAQPCIGRGNGLDIEPAVDRKGKYSLNHSPTVCMFEKGDQTMDNDDTESGDIIGNSCFNLSVLR